MAVDLSDRKISGEIINACRVGDRDAFRALYGFYKDQVYSIALYFFHGDAAIAADVTQQVFLKLIVSMRQFRGESEFSTWLYRLVVNACLDARRSRRAEPAGHKANLDELVAPASHEEDYARAEAANSVRKAVSALPKKFRIAILLRYFEDLSYEQMASALGCSMGTVASRLNRGHRLLAERLRAWKGGKQ